VKACAQKDKPQASKKDDGFQEVEVYKAVGYSNGKVIGESLWDPDRSKAQEEKRKMERVEKVGGKMYDKVEIVKGTERRYVGKGTAGGKPPLLEENTRPKGRGGNGKKLGAELRLSRSHPNNFWKRPLMGQSLRYGKLKSRLQNTST
jgi:hypothetical protein